MKTWIKNVLERNAALRPIAKASIWCLRWFLEARAFVCCEILRVQFIALRISHRKPLLVLARFGGIGDIVSTFPALQELARSHPSFHAVFVTRNTYAALPRMARVSATILAPSYHCRIPRLPRFIVARIYEPITTREAGKEDFCATLSAEYAKSCGIDKALDQPRLFVPESLATATKLGLKLKGSNDKIVMFHTGPTWLVREWPSESWQILANLLRSRRPVRIFHVGTESHVTIGKKAVKTFTGVESLLGKLSLEELVAAISLADVFIGVDSGMLHIAAALRVPSIGIFGPTDPKHVLSILGPNAVFHQLPCSFCHHRLPSLHWESGCPHEIACMRLLAPEQVLDRCLSILDQESPQPAANGNAAH